MVTLAVIRKKSEAGFALHHTRLIIDPTDGSINPLFWQSGVGMRSDIFANDTDITTAFERACEHGCPTYVDPGDRLMHDDDPEPLTTMLYPIPLSSSDEEVIATLKMFGKGLHNDELSGTIASVGGLYKKNFDEYTLADIFDRILRFCMALPIPKIIPFGRSESSFWAELRDIYRPTGDEKPVTQ